VSALALRPAGQLVLEPDVDHDAPGSDRERQDARGLAPGSENLGGEPSLDIMVSGMWEGLAVHRSVDCPLCGAEIVPVYGVHHRPIGGRCRGCATTLS
jgi:hypothetical protein